jgi:uncharacterized protein YggE
MNRRISIIAGLVLSLGILTGCDINIGTAPAGGAASPSTTPESPRIISVTGEGKVSVTPDIAVMYLSIISRDSDVSKAWEDNNAKADATIAALKEQGILEKDIRSDFNLYQQEKTDQFGQPTGEITYVVTHTLTVTARDMSKLGDILGAAQAAGVNSVGGITYTLEDPSAAIKQVRALAVADALERAKEIAAGLGVTVGKVLSISEYGVSLPAPAEKGYSMGIGGGGGSSVPIQVGTWEITMSISVVFEIQ